MPARRALFPLLPLLLAAASCHQGQVTAYRIPKEADPTLPPAANPPPGMAANSGGAMSGNVPTVEGPELSWQAPPDWKAGPTNAMRKGSYLIPGQDGEADLSITAFPGDVGGELANVNRWRGQQGLPPLSQGDLDQHVDRFQSHGLHFLVVDLWDGKTPNAMLGAIAPYGDGVWFFKLTGPHALVARVKPAFQAFLQSVRPPAT